jgi:hypothetical protein
MAQHTVLTVVGTGQNSSRQACVDTMVAPRARMSCSCTGIPVMVQSSATCTPPPPAAAAASAAAAAGALCGGTTVSRSLGTRRSLGYSLPPLQILCSETRRLQTGSQGLGSMGCCQQGVGHLQVMDFQPAPAADQRAGPAHPQKLVGHQLLTQAWHSLIPHL